MGLQVALVNVTQTDGGSRSRLLDDVLAQPAELTRIVAGFTGAKRPALERAAGLMRDARHVTVVGIGSSWNAGMVVSSLLRRGGPPALLADASELLHFGTVPSGSVVLVLSRSGKSVEIVRLLERCEAAGAPVVAITNTRDTPLSRRAAVTLQLEARFDHLVSITMYSGLALVGGLLAEVVRGAELPPLGRDLRECFAASESLLGEWRRRLEGSRWLDAAVTPYFLARGTSAASAHEARLLWEEVAKRPAAALTTGGFRHGSQETVRAGSRIALWLDPLTLRREDLALAGELREAGASVMLVGQDLPRDAADLVMTVPESPVGWQFAVDVIPAQLAAERLAAIGGENCDAFRFCPYVVESEGGLGPARAVDPAGPRP